MTFIFCVLQMTCPFGEQRVTNRSCLLDLKSSFGISVLRDNVTQSNGGTVVGSTTTNTGEFMFATTATANSQSALQTNERVLYQSGYGMEVGVGLRMSSALLPAGVQARWGVFDTINGYYWQWDTVNKLSCNVVRASSITQVVQSNFNTDKLDGTGPSGVTLDMTRGIIFHITYSWYGYGAIIFNFVTTDNLGNTLLVPCHQFSFPGQTSTASPHQPIRVDLTNVSGNTAATGLYLGGRQASTIGSYNPVSRVTALTLTNKTYSTTNTFLIAFRKKAAYVGAKCLLTGVDVACPVNTIIYVNTQCTVAAGTWASPPNTLSSETAIEVNTTFNTPVAGTQIYSALSGPYTTLGPLFDGVAMTDTDIMLLSLTSVAGAGNQTVQGIVVRITELW
jgi:hypothetical protein